jgi:hypothetical protein
MVEFAMDNDWLKNRFEELTKLAEARQFDWQSAVKALPPKEYKRRIVGLATKLDLSISDVLDPQLSLSEIDERSARVREVQQSRVR